MTKSQYNSLEIMEATVLVQYSLKQQLATARGKVIKKERKIMVVATDQEELPIFPSRIITVHRLT